MSSGYIVFLIIVGVINLTAVSAYGEFSLPQNFIEGFHLSGFYRVNLWQYTIIDKICSALIDLPAGLNINQIDSGNSAMVYIEGDSIVAESSNGTVIISGKAKTDTGSVIQSAINYIGTRGSGKLLIIQAKYADMPKNLNVFSNMIIEGGGTSTILNNLSFSIKSKSNVTIRNITFTGNADYAVLISEDTNNTRLENLTASLSDNSIGAFCQYALNGVINNTKFISCRVIDSGSIGFFNDGSGTPALIKNSTYINCEAIRCGQTSRKNEWVVGFDIAENCNVENINLINCKAMQNWESGFHIEDRPLKKNVRLINCTSINNGRDKPSVVYGSGFLVSSGVSITSCDSSNNILGYRLTNNKEDTIVINNCTDIQSDHSLYIRGETGKVIIDEFVSKDSRLESMSILGSKNIYAKGLNIINPRGNSTDHICAYFGLSGCPISDSEFEIYASGGIQPFLIYTQGSSNLTFKGQIKTKAAYALDIVQGSKIIVDSMVIDCNGVAGIWVHSGTKNVRIKNTIIKNTLGGIMDYGVLVNDSATKDVAIDRTTVKVLSGIDIPFYGVSFQGTETQL